MSSADLYRRVLQEEGFHLIGQLNYRLHVTAWWNPAPDKRLQVLIIDIGGAALIKGDKSYYLKSFGAAGDTWARDIPALHAYLEDHFPELRISLSHFRDVPPALARIEAERRLSTDAPIHPLPSVEQIAELQRRLEIKQKNRQCDQRLLALSQLGSDVLSGYVHQRGRSEQSEIQILEANLERQQGRMALLQHLQREYQRKGSAASYGFSISSNLQIIDHASRFRDALHSVVKELIDQDRYQVRQKLQGGRLNIQVAEAQEPALAWIELWMGGALSPVQLQRLGPAFEALSRHMMVTPDEPIVVDGHLRQAEKHLAGRVLSTVLSRLDKTDADGQKVALDASAISSAQMPLHVGLRTDPAGKVIGPVALPLTQIIHACVSGTTGSGKSYLARAIVEEASEHTELNILVLDPRNQFVGLLVPEDRPRILQHYDDFGMKPSQARGFAFNYFAPALPFVPPLPPDLSSLAMRRSIVSFKGMEDMRRCAVAGDILDAVFEAMSDQESERPRLVIVVDEAQLLTRKKVDESAKHTATQTERALDRIAREGRKYGLVLILMSQTIRDFSHDLASLRQMTNTKIFLRNSDREIEYASDLIGDGRALAQLPSGTALVHNGDWGLHRIRIRPPLSKVFELCESDIRRLVGSGQNRATGVTVQAERLLAAIKEHQAESKSQLNLSQAAILAGITSRRRLLELIGELERAGVIQTRHLPERGRPRVIELRNQSSAPSARHVDNRRTQADTIA